MIGAITAGLFSTGVAASTTSYESIATVTVGAGGSSSISFSSIPSTFKHLQIRAIARMNTGNIGPGAFYVGFNGDTTYTNYFGHETYGSGTTTGSAYDAPTTNGLGAPAGMVIGGTGLANDFGVGIVDILDYTNTNKNKTLRSLAGADYNGAGGYLEIISGAWLSTASVNSITITNFASSSFVQYSQFALYGIKG
jgi:hypothetical protein